MSTQFAITTLLEIAAVLLLIWGFANEKKFIAFEDKLAVIIGRTIVLIRRRRIQGRKSEQVQNQKLQLQRAEVTRKAPGKVA